MKRTTLLALTAASALGLAACGGSAPSYPANVQTNLLNACEQSGTVSQCDCALKYIEAHVPLRQFVAAEQAMTDDGAPTPVWATTAGLNCRGS